MTQRLEIPQKQYVFNHSYTLSWKRLSQRIANSIDVSGLKPIFIAFLCSSKAERQQAQKYLYSRESLLAGTQNEIIILTVESCAWQLVSRKETNALNLRPIRDTNQNYLVAWTNKLQNLTVMLEKVSSKKGSMK